MFSFNNQYFTDCDVESICLAEFDKCAKFDKKPLQTRGSLRLENCQFLQKHVCQRVYVLLSLHVLFLFCLHNYYLLTILYIFKSYYSCGGAMIAVLGCVSLRKSKIGFLNPKESKNRFCVSLLNRSIQDLSD